MTTANLVYFNRSPEVPNKIRLVDFRKRITIFTEFAVFKQTLEEWMDTYGLIVSHSRDIDKVSLTLVYPPTGQKRFICDVADGEAVTVYPGPRSQNARHPRLEVRHGKDCGEPEIVNIVEILSEGMVLER